MYRIISAVTSPAETASSLSSSIQSTFTTTSSTITNKVADNYNKLNESYPYLSSSLSNPRSTIKSTLNSGTDYIYSIPSSIGNTVHSYTSIFEPVDESEEREITRTPPNENLDDNVIPLRDDRIEIVNHILSLYSCKISKECFKHYDDEVVFEDPLMYVTGLSNLKAQFYAMQKLFLKSSTVNYKILENTRNVLKMSLSQRYVLPFISRAVLINSVIILEFNENDKISKHSDLWAGKPVGKEGVSIFKRNLSFFFLDLSNLSPIYFI
ncbi:hypothetical protein C1645_758559 [Glomus cerebriforme]|uniref:Uncharacterized protein n=1 Tax=Glomus cerebriforme TaxID=658196 RepID=A0A397TJE7_9GLOM|nr:hypothetical protein C1645_758559 [Glomus cerebriforme]